MDGVPKYGNDSKISHKSAILGYRIIHKKWKSDWGNDSPFFGVCVCSLTPTNMVTMGNLGMGLPHYMDIWYVGFVFQGLRNRLKSVVTLICLPAEIPLTVNLIKANHQVLPPVSCHHLGLVVSSMGVSENEGYPPNWLYRGAYPSTLTHLFQPQTFIKTCFAISRTNVPSGNLTVCDGKWRI